MTPELRKADSAGSRLTEHFHILKHSVPNPARRQSILYSQLEHGTITGYLSSDLHNGTVTESSENVPETFGYFSQFCMTLTDCKQINLLRKFT